MHQIMTYLVLQFERVPTASGEMLVATDEEGLLRALDWEDCEARMHKLLCLHYGANNVRLDRRRLDRARFPDGSAGMDESPPPVRLPPSGRK
jgi:hypothetical protein